jgi:hypothetical protein
MEITDYTLSEWAIGIGTGIYAVFLLQITAVSLSYLDEFLREKQIRFDAVILGPFMWFGLIGVSFLLYQIGGK